MSPEDRAVFNDAFGRLEPLDQYLLSQCHYVGYTLDQIRDRINAESAWKLRKPVSKSWVQRHIIAAESRLRELMGGTPPKPPSTLPNKNPTETTRRNK